MAVTVSCDVCGRQQRLQRRPFSEYYAVPEGWYSEDIKPKGIAGFFGAEPKIEHYCSDICRVAGLGNHALKKPS